MAILLAFHHGASRPLDRSTQTAERWQESDETTGDALLIRTVTFETTMQSGRVFVANRNLRSIGLEVAIVDRWLRLHAPEK